MKRLVALLFFLLLTSIPSWALRIVPSDQVIAANYGPRTSTTLSNVVARLSGRGAHIWLDGGEWVISTNLTLPSNLCISIAKDSSVTTTPGSTFIYNQCVDGTQGPPGTNGINGVGNLVMTGPYVEGKDYYASNMVTFNGSVYYTTNNHFIAWDTPTNDSFGRWKLFVSKGDTGSQGPQGPAGSNGVMGIGNIQYIGMWVDGIHTESNSITTYDGQSYFTSNQFTSTISPDLDTTNWSIFIAKGAIGPGGTNGATGPQGPQGIAGINGTNGWNGTNGTNGWNGINGTNGAPGPAGVGNLIIVGEWLEGMDAYPSNMVTYNGSVYYTTNSHFISWDNPTVDTARWKLFVAKGATGAQGPQGSCESNKYPVATWSFLSAITDCTGSYNTVWNKWFPYAVPLINVGGYTGTGGGTATVQLLIRPIEGITFTTATTFNIAYWTNIDIAAILPASNSLGLRIFDGVTATGLTVNVMGWLP